MGKITQTIEEKLNKAFQPVYLKIKDESEKHKGHAGYREGGETHFRVVVVSDVFEGMKKIERHQKVYDLLREELRENIHALSLKTLTQKEYHL